MSLPAFSGWARNLQRSRARRPRSDANQQAFFLWQAACHE
jgi:hypothetical protein